ncbi:hypothetical protein NQ317_007875 [Molorchus minor]|uniref:SH3 domain-containing protein n=1 Tax=Molorchus minor TaxID=1323400 RepID=A0ABQ9IVY2_9CUCU|nr:hypothetical protein NQ317_007875 [Molorchus minor]
MLRLQLCDLEQRYGCGKDLTFLMLTQIYEELYHTINNADYEKDLKWWSGNHGVNMAMNWPQFEDYIEEFRDIHKGKSKDSSPSGITLIHQRPVGEDLHTLYKNGSTNKANESNPFEEEDWEENDALVDNGEPGVPVKALYDYEGAENDELSDVFEKLEDEDEQGWCKGRKDGRVGLYPANYVEVVPH